MEVRQDVCGKCGGWLDWFFDPMQDAGKCEDCGEVWHPFDSDDVE